MNLRLLRILIAAALGTLGIALLAGCGSSEGTAAGATVPVDRKVAVTTTTNFITDTVRQIGGDRVEVTGLMGPGVDPHLYKASARDVADLRDADVVFYGGLHLEGKMGDLLGKLAEKQTTTAVMEEIPERDLLEPPAGLNAEHDPHVWFDVANWKVVARTIADTLKQKDPAHAAEYDERLAAYLRELDATDRYVERRIAEIPPRQRVLITSHDAFQYFGKRYAIDVAGIQGISTVAEATTADVQRIAQLIADRDVKAVFIESSVPRQTIDAVLAAAEQKGADAHVGGELYTDAAGDEGTPEGTYIGMVRANADKIAEGLR
ncbi:metal ABC transporter solute-binding protein, Zn/Mn family [Conexibacter woesei]|uniref:Periplasmic solute binding protein n=1 Tax=Conexibacter woesei (strain DSM 14684 / CCUG 47730 / CIP 108061 / JCM 11494 / NBRC 100937 / ID131577) TaxID=469383 RepID=D3F1X8_CONWI|nr:zinc ABC transporter substrate-binding protein [Conexibacter woesei]ADB54159.1 periplasmic solute binding protein [Conexibacter woesei DSM 14684]